MKAWHNALSAVTERGVRRDDRTGIGTLALFGMQLEFDNSDTFPAVTTKHLAFGQVAKELTCFIRGYDNLEDFHRVGCTIWDGNAQQTSGSRFAPLRAGDLGRIYGVQWRKWLSANSDGLTRLTDQLADLVTGLRLNPYSRRHIVTMLNPGELDDVCLPPCHVLFQCFVAEGQLHLRVDMRSVDLFIGLPFDVASYALLQRLLAKETNLGSGKLIFQLGDAHVYLNHLEQVITVLNRSPMPPPGLDLDASTNLFSFEPSQAKLVSYKCHPAIPAPLNL